MKRLLLIGLVACGCKVPVTEPVAQNPPVVGVPEVEAWLEAGYYLAWHCDPSPHPAPTLSVHGMARACANDVAFAASRSSTSGQLPIDAAYVLESYDDTTGTIDGFTLQRRTRDGATGDTWYWYGFSTVDDAGVTANGWGFGGTPQEATCINCHAQAGVGAQSGRDFTFVVVPL